MEVRINFELESESDFDMEAAASHLPGETWKLFDDEGNFIKAYRGNKPKEEAKGCGNPISDTDNLPCGTWHCGDQHFCKKCFAKGGLDE